MLHPHDVQRIIRALYIARNPECKSGSTDSSPFDYCTMVLYRDRAQLYTRINERVDMMMEQGLFEELQLLLLKGLTAESPGLKCVGYQEFFNYIEKNISFTDAVEKIKELCDGIGADKAYTYVRNPKATEDIFKSTKEGASICTFVGLEGQYELQEYYERTLVWSFYFTPTEYTENLKFIKDNKINLKQIVSDVFSLDNINEAFKKRSDQPKDSLKIVIKMD